MRFKGTVALFAVLIALGATLYFVELRGTKKSEEEAKPIFSFSEFDIVEITITGPTDTVVLQQIKDHPETPWKIILPIDTVADEGVVSAFASQLATLESTRKVEENPSDLTAFGLDPPAYSVLVILKGQDSDILEVGGEGITGQSVYVKVGNTVYLVGNGIKSYLSRGIRDWRRQELFRFFSSDVTSVQLEWRGEVPDRAELAKVGEEWLIKGPVSEKADFSNVFIFLGGLSSLRGEEFIDEKKEERVAALGSPLFQVKLSLGSVRQEGYFYKTASEPDFIYAATTPKAPLYKISLKRFEEIYKPISYFKLKKEEALPPAPAVDKKD